MRALAELPAGRPPIQGTSELIAGERADRQQWEEMEKKSERHGLGRIKFAQRCGMSTSRRARVPERPKKKKKTHDKNTKKKKFKVTRYKERKRNPK